MLAGPINIPAADSALPTADVPVLVKQIAAYVVKRLPDYFKAYDTEFLPAGDQKPHEYGALKIALKGETGMMSYKAAWEAEAAKISLKSTGMYEASANLLWLNPFPRTTMAQQIAGNPPSWSQLTEAVAMFMTKEAAQEQTLAEAPLAPPQGSDKCMRMIFPLTVPAHCEQADTGGATGILGIFDVVTGHLYLWAWYLGMYQAMRADDAPLVASLWQMALTTSVHLRHGLTEKKLAIWSIQSAEQSRFQEGCWATHSRPLP